MKKILKIMFYALLALLLFVCGFVLYLTVTEYKPEPVEGLAVKHTEGSKSIELGTELDVISWNIGYCGLGRESDFFMDGGKDVRPDKKITVIDNFYGIENYLKSEAPAPIVMLQEVDIDSHRSYGIDQTAGLAGANAVHALNYSCDFVPFPLPPIAKVNSGLFTVSDYAIERAERISLPCPFSWPVSTANLKRCLLVSYLPIEASSKQLVLVNLHLEAYDDGEGKIAQANQLRDFIQAEYEKGNYVIAGGDFNQSFPGSRETYPSNHPELWEPGVLEEDFLPDDWYYAYDLESPSCRLLNQPYNPEDAENTQYFVIDGFILSPNITLNSVETVDMDFEYSDHNPIRINISLN